MSKVKMLRRCYNCGAVLQSDNKNEPGYIDSAIFAASPLDDVIFCENCYKEVKFNLTPKKAPVKKDFLTMLYDAKASDALIVYVVDLFSFECSFVEEITDIIRRLPIIVVANKRDLMPKEAVDADLREYVAHRFRVAEIPLSANDVVLTSLTSSADIKPLMERIEEKRRRHDVYIIGGTGAGKSLFFSSFLSLFDNPTGERIITKDYPDTNLSVMTIPLDSSSYLYDTPGTSLENSLFANPDPSFEAAIKPQKEIKLRESVLTEGETIMFGSVAAISLLKSDAKRTVLSLFGSENVKVKKINTPESDEKTVAKLLEREADPFDKAITSLKDFDIYDFPIEEEGRRDIGIAGLGWLSFTSRHETFRVYVPKGIGVYGSRAKVK